MTILVKRFLSLVIDYAVFQIGCFVALLIVSLIVVPSTNTILTVIYITMFLQLYWREHLYSIGRTKFKLKLIDQNTKILPSRLKCLTRAILIVLLPIDIVYSLFNKDHFTLTDMITKTQVIIDEETI